MKFKINKPLKHYKAGQIVDIPVNEYNVPLEHYWRRRLADAQIDNCIEIVKPEPKTVKTEEKPKKTAKN